MNKAGSVGRNLTITYGVQALGFFQGLIIMPIVILLVGVDGFGAYILLNFFLSFLYGVTACGIFYRYRRNVVSTSDPLERRRLLEPQFTFHMIVLGLTSIALTVVWPSIQRLLFSGAVEFSWWLFLVWVAQYAVYREVQDYFRYTLRIGRFNLLVGAGTFLFIAMVAITAVMRRPLSLDGLIALQIVSLALPALPFAVSILREIGLPRPRLPFREILADLRIGYPLTLALVIDFVLGSSDRYLIGFFMSVADVGRYQPAYQLGSVLNVLPRTGQSVLMTSLSRLVDLDARQEAERLLSGFLDFFLMIAMPFALGAVMVGPSIVALLTTPAIAAASCWVTPLVAVASIFYGFMILAFQVAFVEGRTLAIIQANVIGAAINLGLNLVLIPLFKDITIPAATTLVGYMVSCGFTVLALRRIWSLRVDALSIIRYCGAALVMGGALWLMGYRPAVPRASDAGTLISTMAIAAAVYFSSLALLGGFGALKRRRIAGLFTNWNRNEE